MSRFLNSLKGRVFLLSVLATLLVILLSSWIFSVDRARYTADLQKGFLLDYTLLTLKDVQTLPADGTLVGRIESDAIFQLEGGLLPGSMSFPGHALPGNLMNKQQRNLFWDATFWLEASYTLGDLPDAPEHSSLYETLRTALPVDQVRKIFIKQPAVSWNGAPGLFNKSGVSIDQAAVEATMIVSLLLPDGRTLNIMPVFSAQEDDALWDYELILLIAALFGCMVLINLWVAAWMTRPLGNLERAAARFGRDLNAPLLPEKGITEVAQAGKAFNRMQNQITSLIEGRTSMLAAISHDLRTPITRLRLRAELLQDAQIKADIDKDLQDITTMVNATLEFLRNDALVEAVETVNLAALVQDYCAERQSVGDAITVSDLAKDCPLSLRPLAVKRALGNLIDNGLHYGGQVTVSLHWEGNQVLLRVCDDGPGIAAQLLPEVVKPFVRGEQSRSRDTGGTGLGLSIVTSIMQLHGGEVQLKNGMGGFCAVMVFPDEERL